MPAQTVSMAVPAHQPAPAAPSPRLAPTAATLRCKRVRDVSHLDATTMSALRLGGKLMIGKHAFSVRLDNAADKPRYVVQALARSGSGERAMTPAAEASRQAQAAMLATRLANRHVQLADRVHRFTSDRHLVELCRAFAISRDLNVLPFKEFLAKCKDGAKLRFHGQDYYVHVEPGKRGMADAAASLVPVGQPTTPLARLLQALRNLLRFPSSRPPLRTVEQLLTRAVRAYHAGDSVPAESPSPAAGRARVEAALRATEVARRVAPSTVPDLRGARLAGADLRKLDLSGAILADADLQGALLCGATLVSADLSGANLANADLQDARMARANLRHADLAKARLSRAALPGADLSQANMTEASLIGTTLREARLEHANLSRAIVSFALFAGAQMDGAVLTACYGTAPMFVRARVTNAEFGYAYLPDARFDNVELAGTTFHHATLHNAHFNEAGIGGADFGEAAVEGARFSRVDVGDGKCLLTLSLQAGSDFSIRIRDVDEALAQLTTGVPLRDLPPSPRARRTISEYLFQLACACRDDVRRCAALRNWLLEHPQYEAEAARQVLRRLYWEAERSADSRPLAWPETAPLLPGLMHDAIASLGEGNRAAWARKHAGLVMQLAFLAARPDAPASAAQRKTALMDAYRATLPPALADTVARLENDEGETFFPIVGDAGQYALLVAPEYYGCLIRGESLEQSGVSSSHGALPPTWQSMLRLTAVAEPGNTGAQRYDVGGLADIGKDLAACPLLHNAYVGANRSQQWHDGLLAVLPFGSEYLTDFRSAIADNHAVRRLVDHEHQQALAYRSNEVLIGEGKDVQPTPAHLEALLDTMPSHREDPACQSHFLWCVAAVLARLSSDAFLGTSNDGPFALRRYAAALGNAAICIDASMASVRRNYIERLLSDRCTDELSTHMLLDLSLKRTNNTRQMDVFDTVWPSKWRPHLRNVLARARQQ
ncbi:pentapeptide repeat-containing protein [Cupriavidus gilardii]|uniref:pentapeptide repeat-containing protein n=1 Tax=Cupriavidus gilardii TaxID=82541 RepID=UPI0021BE8C06|nr:pentapeptide repeat-containing protein [Cupriavidus gilardii]MCT9126320.1 pentapeptide repeat-containing protein [Cupriavidus gilardii]